MILRAGRRSLSLDHPVVMGILNVTPDSFSDGGLWLDADAAVAHALAMATDGAAIVDVGGESTRPGAEPVAEDEELRRVLPVVERLAAEGLVISIDTRKPTVAEACIAAGAAIVNDTRGEDIDHGMEKVAAATGAGVVIMHSRGTPATMRSLTTYRDVVTDVGDFLVQRAAQFEAAGVARDAIVLDPGFGFAKTPAQNLELLRRFAELIATGYPVLAGTSRKSFIGAVLGLPEDQRVEGTAATVALAVAAGAAIVRVHDVGAMARVVRMTEAVIALDAAP